MQCSQCGTENTDEMKFCTSCGAKLVAPPTTCPKCGAEVSPEVRFCGQCGQDVTQHIEEEATTTTPEPEQTPPSCQQRPRRGIRIVLAAILAVVVVLAGVFFLWAQGDDAPNPHEVRTFSGIEMVWCPPGTFAMGSPEDEPERVFVEKQHKVTLTRGFWFGKYEVTQAQWEAVMGNNPSQFKGNRLPVECVSWSDCQDFIEKLNADGEGGFRLPSEAQWEYACRAGTTTPFSFGKTITTDQVNYNGDYPYGKGKRGEYREKTTPIGSFPANAWGLHDMHGNVWEWCQDWYGDYPKGGVTDPTGPNWGEFRVLRGGSWPIAALNCRAAARHGLPPDAAVNHYGFRLLRTP